MISLIDWSVNYHPESKTLMDIDTALNFFHEGREATKLRVGNMARALVGAWNRKYEGTSTVNIFINIFLQKKKDKKSVYKNFPSLSSTDKK